MMGFDGLLLLPSDAHSTAHERSVQRLLGEKLAALLGCPFLGPSQPGVHGQGKYYFLPSDTLVGDVTALGIEGPQDFFGGQVEHAFQATKAINHPTLDSPRYVPQGWSRRFARQIESITLPGFTAFDLDDAREAGRRLLRDGPVRLKPVEGCGGRGQQVLRTASELDAALADIDPQRIRELGLVLEEDLQEPYTYSVGQIRVAGVTLSYYGIQQLTSDNSGCQVYGGSELTLVRGEYLALMTLDLPRAVRLAVQQARIFELAVFEAYPAVRASRRNYDVAQGLNTVGRARCGVLEQSWRVGGASAAEIFALEAFIEQPDLQSLQASTHELYGDVPPPPGAICLYQGDEDGLGLISKYVRVTEHERA
ncbi:MULTISPECIES: DUF3182 family protein [Pseudomonadaceae]|jgi:hypothetical protein|uniref:Biotin carboxylase n=1 Tax=Ectopseudomonas mendocina (strain ymp) TaxID=399739 RepID=A4XUN2_ECTM1|nr:MULTISPECIES: DUF3182 family protein [Pseudomonas]ARS48961.1 hypothetical protein PSMEN_11340 [Pseudomonas mendocina]MBA4246165.1 DUF3182 domain-containing protein [Pseudomonas sp.]MBF8163714.1 DUF3182 family protein [Pseudomonas mendocina]MDH0098304.1 DUF3182 family protein [Pseudomonas sp. GD04158]UTH34056.1 DUF3182 family protein [Pseudomonas hydrolytica]